MKTLELAASLLFFSSFAAIASSDTSSQPLLKVGVFKQEIASFYSQANGLPTNEILSIAFSPWGKVYAGTGQGLFAFQNSAWTRVSHVPEKPVFHLIASSSKMLAIIGSELTEVSIDSYRKIADLPNVKINDVAADENSVFLASTNGLYQLCEEKLIPVSELNSLLTKNPTIYSVACTRDKILVGAEMGLLLKTPGEPWSLLYPQDGNRSWAPRSVKSVTIDNLGRLWFASTQGVGCFDGSQWKLYEGKDGLPYNEFTGMAPGEESVVWFGTSKGAIRFDGKNWAYRQGRRWTPDDHITAAAITPEGNAWFATPGGVGFIERRPMTLKEKAEFYENEIEKYIKRTEYGYLSEVRLKNPGDKSQIIYTDSDNDGLWTSMYGAGMCFAYAATHDPAAQARAKQAFEALRFLSAAPIDGEVKQQPGFVARTVLPTTEPDPNLRPSYTLEGMQKNRASNDGRWKVYHPRWPLTQDKKYWYKSDTSSDELDGHFFFYALYYDLVADSPQEKERVREVVRNITDHLIRNDFCLVDHDGTPTRWAVYDPAILNHDFAWYAERGLNSLSILSYLAVAEHVTGDAKYGEAAKNLIENHSYHLNAMTTKIQRGPGSGNQSDDEMAFMNYYNLIKYTQDDVLRDQILFSFFNAWILEFSEMNPFFNYAYAACGNGKSITDPWGTYDMTPWDGWLEDSAETLTGFPLDRINWSHQNSHRLDVVPLPRHAGTDPEDRGEEARGCRVNGKVLPVQERHFAHWNADPWTLDIGGDGRELASGTVFLLPYYMGLYYGFIE